MSKKKILSSILAGSLFGLAIVAPVKAMNVENNSGYVCVISDDEINNLKVSDGVEVLGKKYDLSNVNPSVLKLIAREFGRINSGNLSESDKTKILTNIKNILEDYKKDPKKYENFPETLEYGPTTFLREDILYVQNKIKDLKQEQEALKKTKMVQQEIDRRVKELQNKIDKLSGWINYSVANFNENSYKKMFCNTEITEETNTKQDVKSLISSVYATNSYDKIFKVNVNSNGTYTIDGNVQIPKGELSEIFMRNLEFENTKAYNILKEIEAVKLSKISKEEQDKKIKELEKELQSVRAYGISQEIVLLNIEKETIQLTFLSPEAMKERVSELDKEINEKTKILNDYIEKFSKEEEVKVNSSIGETPSYFPYVLGSGGDVFRISLDKEGKISFENGEKLTDVQKKVVKESANDFIKESQEEIKVLENKKLSLKDNDQKYYLSDAIDKEIQVLKNDISNYELIISQL